MQSGTACSASLFCSPSSTFELAGSWRKSFERPLGLASWLQQHRHKEQLPGNYCCSSAAKNGLAISSAPVVGDTMVTAVPRQTWRSTQQVC